METREQVFERFIDEKLGLLRGTAMRVLGDSADVEDAVQQALLIAWRRYEAFRGQAEFATWVTRILLNVCYDMVRERVRERDVLADYGESGVTPGEASGEETLLDRLDNAIARLPRLYRESLSLGVLSGPGR